MTKQLLDILAPLEESNDPQFILIEGLPGIGKTFLLQEISYKWSTKELLQSFKLALLVHLRDPAVQQALLIKDLLELFFKGDQKAAEITTACSNYFFKSAGKDILFLFDGFDEFPENLQKDSLIASILKRQVLPKCGLVVSSRPHASVYLRQKATVKVDILGFAEEERKLYIEQSLKGHPQKVKELTDYLENPINGLCYVPFIMWLCCFICTSKEFLFQIILLICTIVLFASPFVGILPNLVILLKMISPILPVFQNPITQLSSNWQSCPSKLLMKTS